MRLAIYGRVSTGHQVEHQTIEQQLGRLTAHVGTHAAEGWALDAAHVFRDGSFSGAALARPGLDRLRDAIKGREVDRVPGGNREAPIRPDPRLTPGATATSDPTVFCQTSYSRSVRHTSGGGEAGHLPGLRRGPPQRPVRDRPLGAARARRQRHARESLAAELRHGAVERRGEGPAGVAPQAARLRRRYPSQTGAAGHRDGLDRRLRQVLP